MSNQVDKAGTDLPDESELAVLSSATRRSAKLIGLFLRQVPIELERFEEAVRANDGEQVRQVAHKLKGSCRAVGVLRMAAVCDLLERSRAAADQAGPWHARLAAEYERARVLLEAEQAVAPR
jgi:HPt (histidine-containing phosphotransfer) domain-containing protein